MHEFQVDLREYFALIISSDAMYIFFLPAATLRLIKARSTLLFLHE